MNYKRIELYVWWTCNQECTYCMEFFNMEKKWNKIVTKLEILKYLLKYKKDWYNHVTFLWGEPFIQPVFLDALKIAKKLWYTVLVTTNATTLHIDNEANKYLSYIDELILSVEWIDKEIQQKISQTNVLVYWDKVFTNIDKYWNWNLLKINIVITRDNLSELYDIVKYLKWKLVKDISITYPDLDLLYYWKRHLLRYVAPTYTQAINEVIKIEEYCTNNNILLKIVDFPFCIFPKSKLEKFIKKTDEINYWNRIKVWDELHEIKWNQKLKLVNRKENKPRDRTHVENCDDCKYYNICWGVADCYDELYWLNEIIKIN